MRVTVIGVEVMAVQMKMPLAIVFVRMEMPSFFGQLDRKG
jgi:hypothetical protein